MLTDNEYVLSQGTLIGQIQSNHHDIVRDAIDSLDEFERTVLNMYFYERLTYQAISDELDLKGRQYAHYWVKRALRALKAKLLETGEFGCK